MKRLILWVVLIIFIQPLLKDIRPASGFVRKTESKRKWKIRKYKKKKFRRYRKRKWRKRRKRRRRGHRRFRRRRVYGCHKDTDCKGTRICESGKCVYPRKKQVVVFIRKPRKPKVPNIVNRASSFYSVSDFKFRRASWGKWVLHFIVSRKNCKYYSRRGISSSADIWVSVKYKNGTARDYAISGVRSLWYERYSRQSRKMSGYKWKSIRTIEFYPCNPREYPQISATCYYRPPRPF